MTLQLFTKKKLVCLLLSAFLGILASCAGFSRYSFFKPRTQKSSEFKQLQARSTIRIPNQARNQAVVVVEQRGDLWDSVRADFQLPNYEKKIAVQSQIRWFVNHQRHLHKTIQQASPYIHYIYKQIKKRNLPAELVLIPVIESAYNPLARNTTSGAVGLWQLMSKTAQGLGVHQDRLFDGRRDIHTSTKAALDYLMYLRTFFSGDWILAFAAYDTGEGNIQRAIRFNARRGYSVEFWDLPVSAETRSYVPKFLALVAIVRNPHKYGVSLPPISNEPYLARVTVNKSLSLIQAAHLAGVRLDSLKRLNPGVKNSSSLMKAPYKLMIPINQVAFFKQGLITFKPPLPPRHVVVRNASSSTGWPPKYHTVKSGETLSGISQQYQIPLRDLYSRNSLKKDGLLKPGTVLILGGQISSTHSSSSHSNSPKIVYYVVRPNDNLFLIAKRFGVRVANLKTWNQLKQSTLRPGQRLAIYQMIAVPNKA